MTKRMVLMLLIAGVIFGAIFGFQAFKSRMIKKYLSSQGVPPQTVSTTKAGFKEWQPERDARGTLRAARGGGAGHGWAGGLGLPRDGAAGAGRGRRTRRGGG